MSKAGQRAAATAVFVVLACGPLWAQNRPSGWIADARTGCRVWNFNPAVDDRISWDGPCVNGYAHGKGTLRWYSGDKHYETDEGDFRNGKANGHVVMTFTDGGRFDGLFVDQAPEGQGAWQSAKGEVFSGQWHKGCFDQGGRRTWFNTTSAACGFR